MAESVTFEFRLKDLFSAGIKKAEQTGKKAFDTLENESDQFDKKLKRNAASAQQVGTGLKTLAGLATRVFAGLAIGNAIKSMAQLSMEAEQTKVAFEVMMGSAAGATKIIKELSDFAAATPFEKREIVQGGRQLLAYGVSADQVKDKLKLLGNISAGTGKNINELVSIYGKNKMSGLIQGEDLNQLNDAGIPAVREIARVMGVAETRVKKLASEGKISFSIFEQALGNMVGKGGLYFNMMEKQSQTLAGRLSTLKDNIIEMGTSIGDKFLSPLIGRFLQFSNEFMSNLDPIKNAFRALGDAFQPVLDGINEVGIAMGWWTAEGVNGATVAQNIANIIGNYLVPVVKAAANAFKILTDFVSRNSELVKGLAYAAAGAWALLKVFAMIRSAIAFVQAMRVAILAMNAALWANPIGLIIGVVGALIGAFIYAWNEVEGFKESIFGLWDAVKWAFQNIGTFIPKVLTNIAKFFKETFAPFFQALDAFKKGDYATAAKLAGKGLLQANPIVMQARFMKEIFSGKLFEGTGADQVFSDTKNKMLREKKMKEQQEALDKLVAQGKADPATMTSPTNTVRTVPNTAGGLSEEAVRVKGDAPKTVTINNKFDIKVSSANLPDAARQIEEQFAQFVANMANITSQSAR